MLPTSVITADFSTAYIDVNLDVSMPSQVSYKLRGGISSMGGAFFSGPLAGSGTGCLSTSNACDPGSVQRQFSGGVGQHAIIGFTASSSINGAFGSAAAFSQSNQISTPVSTAQPGLYTVLSNGSQFTSPSIYSVGGGSQPNFYGDKLTSVAGSLGSTSNNGARAGDFGAIEKVGDADFVGWGYWAPARNEQITPAPAPSPTPSPSPSPTPSPTPSPSPSVVTTLESVHYLLIRPFEV